MINVAYPHPGEILGEDFLLPMGITRYRLAKEIGVPQRRVDEVVGGQRSITADTALRLSRYFGTSDEFWLNLQSEFDLRVAKRQMAGALKAIAPLKVDSSKSVSAPPPKRARGIADKVVMSGVYARRNPKDGMFEVKVASKTSTKTSTRKRA